MNKHKPSTQNSIQKQQINTIRKNKMHSLKIFIPNFNYSPNKLTSENTTLGKSSSVELGKKKFKIQQVKKPNIKDQKLQNKSLGQKKVHHEIQKMQEASFLDDNTTISSKKMRQMLINSIKDKKSKNNKLQEFLTKCKTPRPKISKKMLAFQSQSLRKKMKTDHCQYPMQTSNSNSSVQNINVNLNINISDKLPPGYISPTFKKFNDDKIQKGPHIANIKTKYFKNSYKDNIQQKIQRFQTHHSKQQHKSNMQAEKTKPFNNTNIKVIKKIGDGQIGDIYLAYARFAQLYFVIKCFKKSQVELDFLIDQWKIQLYCKHPNILSAYGYHVGKNQAYLIIEAGKCNLFSIMRHQGRFKQSRAAHYITQILQGLQYLHRNGVLHRDLKPQNIIVFQGDVVKISDFGWSIRTNVMRKTFCGTYDYVCPEVAKGQYYDEKIDCWCIGVLTYEMLIGNTPFDQKKFFQNSSMSEVQIKFPSYVSLQAQHFMANLLKIAPEKRMSVNQALQHGWLNKGKKYICRSVEDIFGTNLTKIKSILSTNQD